MSRLLGKYDLKALALIKKISPVAWRHILLNGHYTFRDGGQFIDLDAVVPARSGLTELSGVGAYITPREGSRRSGLLLNGVFLSNAATLATPRGLRRAPRFEAKMAARSTNVRLTLIGRSRQ